MTGALAGRVQQCSPPCVQRSVIKFRPFLDLYIPITFLTLHDPSLTVAKWQEIIRSDIRARGFSSCPWPSWPDNVPRSNTQGTKNHTTTSKDHDCLVLRSSVIEVIANLRHQPRTDRCGKDISYALAETEQAEHCKCGSRISSDGSTHSNSYRDISISKEAVDQYKTDKKSQRMSKSPKCERCHSSHKC